MNRSEYTKDSILNPSSNIEENNQQYNLINSLLNNIEIRFQSTESIFNLKIQTQTYREKERNININNILMKIPIIQKKLIESEFDFDQFIDEIISEEIEKFCFL